MKNERINKELESRLRKIVSRDNRIKLPHGIDFVKAGSNALEIVLKNGTNANMQEDCAAFEGWAIVLRRWLKEFDKIILKWDYGKKEDLHYKRFLYRVYKFREIFDGWFDVARKNKQLLDEVVDFDSDNYVLSAPGKVREETIQPLRKTTKENALEKQFLNEARRILAEAAGLDIEKIDCQLPVGIFHREAKAKNEVFPRRKSAVDIWGIGKDSKILNIFELKDSKNMKVGVISELFFYAMLMEDIQKGRIKFGKISRSKLKPEEEIPATDKIKAYILAPQLHPLIDKEVLNIFNRAFSNKGRSVEFGYLEFGEKLGRINYVKICK